MGPDFEITGYAVFSMFVYGFFAAVSDNLSFDWMLAAGIILFCFAMDTGITLVGSLSKGSA